MLLRGYDISVIIYLIPVILVSITFHELSHAYISYKLGDPTAKQMGRLTLNPISHLDPLGTIMILLAGFGWAKPVPINPMYYKNRKRGTLIVSLAGPLSNIFLAFIFSIPMVIIGEKYGASSSHLFMVSSNYLISWVDLEIILFNLSRFFYIINISLAAFNILPVPPLDGSKILSAILPQRQYFKLIQYENYIAIFFLIIIFVMPQVLSTIMSPLIWGIESAIRFLTTLLLGLG